MGGRGGIDLAADLMKVLNHHLLKYFPRVKICILGLEYPALCGWPRSGVDANAAKIAFSNFFKKILGQIQTFSNLFFLKIPSSYCTDTCTYCA
jgi:hypothetical protein